MLRRFVVAGGGGGGRFEIAAIGGEGYGSVFPVVRRGIEESALGSERRRGEGGDGKMSSKSNSRAVEVKLSFEKLWSYSLIV